MLNYPRSDMPHTTETHEGMPGFDASGESLPDSMQGTNPIVKAAVTSGLLSMLGDVTAQILPQRNKVSGQVCSPHFEI